MGDRTTIGVLGAGSWGTALALALARNHHRVYLWSHNQDRAAELQAKRSNERYLPGFPFPSNIFVCSDIAEVIATCEVYLIVTPSNAFRETIVKLKLAGIAKNALVAWATKGFDSGSAASPALLSQVVAEELGVDARQAVVSGPSFSNEVAAGLPTAVTTAANDEATALYVAELFHAERMRVYTNTDFIGVQVGGAAKNVMAIAAGISDGLGYGANSRSAIITRGLAEIARLGVALGADKETFLGLAALGDLVLTCTDDQSRNRRFGLSLGRGYSVRDSLDSIDQEVEGYTTAREVMRLAKFCNVEMPITQQVHAVLYGDLSANDAVTALLKRQLANE